MKTLLRIAVASLALAGMTALATPAIAGPGHAELRVQTGYYSAPVYGQPRVVYEAPAPMYRYRDNAAWREHEWRERERREHYWRERNAWREHEWREHHDRERWGAWR
jgi:hypothetical protein